MSLYPTTEQHIIWTPFVVSRVRRKILVDGPRPGEALVVETNSQEFALLELLTYHRGQVVTDLACIQHIWKDHRHATPHRLNMLAYRVRKKLQEARSKKQQYLRRQRGVGYYLETSP